MTPAKNQKEQPQSEEDVMLLPKEPKKHSGKGCVEVDFGEKLMSGSKRSTYETC